MNSFIPVRLGLLLLMNVLSASAMGDDEILESYPALKTRVLENLKQVKEGRGKHVVFGRVVLEGDEDPIYIKSQMLILPGGYFCDTVKDLQRPIGFRKHQYEPLDVSLENKEGDLINLGVIRLKRLSEDHYVPLRGNITLEDSIDYSQVKVSLSPGNGPVNTPTNGTEPRPKWPAPIHVDVSEDAIINAKEFSPIRYYCKIEAPGYVKFAEYINFDNESGFDLGRVDLEKEKDFTLTYFASPIGNFSEQDVQTAHQKPGDRWKASPEIYGFDLEFDQQDGHVFFNARYHPCSIHDFGKGDLSEFRNADLTLPAQRVRDYKVQDRHVYLIHQRFWKRYILLKIEMD